MPFQCTCSFCGRAFFTRGRRGAMHCSVACSRATIRRTKPIEISDDGATARVPLCGRDGTVRAYALIDAADAVWAGRWTWRLTTCGYVRRGEQVDGAWRNFHFHRELLGLAASDRRQVDHINRDRLDNRRANLRVVTKAENAQNQSKQAGTSSRYRGVCWDSTNKKWVAYVGYANRLHRLGAYLDEQQAAEVAKVARARMLAYAID